MGNSLYNFVLELRTMFVIDNNYCSIYILNKIKATKLLRLGPKSAGSKLEQIVCTVFSNLEKIRYCPRYVCTSVRVQTILPLGGLTDLVLVWLNRLLIIPGSIPRKEFFLGPVLGLGEAFYFRNRAVWKSSGFLHFLVLQF